MKFSISTTNYDEIDLPAVHLAREDTGRFYYEIEIETLEDLIQLSRDIDRSLILTPSSVRYGGLGADRNESPLHDLQVYDDYTE